MKKYAVIFFLMLSALGFPISSIAQFDTTLVRDTWRSLWIINGHSSETTWPNHLYFTITHRFVGTTDLGIDEFFGMDRSSNTRLGLAYGITKDLTIGIGRSSRNKVYDGFIKYNLIKQRYNGFPVNITVLGASQVLTRPWTDFQNEATDLTHRMSYTSQLLVASKLFERLSLQLSPTLIHRNLTEEIGESNTDFALGYAARYRINDVISLQAEYFHRLNPPELEFREAYDVVGFSVDFSTVRHSFQLQFTNNINITEPYFLSNTQDDFFHNGVHFGFHITRKFGF